VATENRAATGTLALALAAVTTTCAVADSRATGVLVKVALLAVEFD
jgi:hypothetical protein